MYSLMKSTFGIFSPVSSSTLSNLSYNWCWEDGKLQHQVAECDVLCVQARGRTQFCAPLPLYASHLLCESHDCHRLARLAGQTYSVPWPGEWKISKSLSAQKVVCSSILRHPNTRILFSLVIYWSKVENMPNLWVDIKPLQMMFFARKNEPRLDQFPICRNTLDDSDQLIPKPIVWPLVPWYEVLKCLHPSSTTSLTSFLIHVVNIPP